MGLATKLIEQARQLGRRQYGEFVRECREQRRFTPEQFHVREAAEAAFGPTWDTTLRRVSANREWTREANTAATDVTAFRDVIAGLTVHEMETGYEAVTSVIGDLIGTYPTPDKPTGTFDIYETFSAVDNPKPIAPATEYPRTSFRGLRVTAPEPLKHGLVGALTLETVKENDSKGFLDAQREVGRQVGDYVNDLRIRVITGINNAGGYVQNGSTFNTYLGSGAWANQLDDFNIANGPAELDRANQLFERMVHPVTGRSIRVRPTAILAVSSQAFQLRSIVRATEIRTTAGSVQTVGANPLAGMPEPVTDPEVRRLFLAEGGLTAAQVDTHLWYGDFKNAFWEREVEPFGVYEAGEADLGSVGFLADIVYACKARYWAVPFARNPRYVLRLRKLS
jgi:hypothetical protein